ncbi:MAG: hypothetical protein ABW171_04450, partial [Steroidobacter sp.]
SVDAYSLILGGLAAGRELMYAHARKVSEYGHGTAVRGHDPVTSAVAGAIAAVSIAFISLIVGLVAGAMGGAPHHRLHHLRLPSRLIGKCMLRSPRVIGELERALANTGEHEIAGLLLEDATGEQRFQRAPNLCTEPCTIEVPRWWLERRLRCGSVHRPIAFVHSHVTSLEPSDADRASLQNFPLPWIIVRLHAGKLEWAVLPAQSSV